VNGPTPRGRHPHVIVPGGVILHNPRLPARIIPDRVGTTQPLLPHQQTAPDLDLRYNTPRQIDDRNTLDRISDWASFRFPILILIRRLSGLPPDSKLDRLLDKS